MSRKVFVKKSLFVTMTVLGLVGVATGVGAIYTHKKTAEFIDKSQATIGKVVDVERSVNRKTDGRETVTYYPVVEFVVGAKKFLFKSQYGSSSYRNSIGREIDVLYHSSDPSQARVNSFLGLWMVPILLSLFAISFGCIPLGFFLYVKHRKKTIQTLKCSGTRVQAKFIGVDKNHSMRVNGRSPWILVCQWIDLRSNTTYIFKSENYWFDPTEFVQKETLDVLIDRNNPKKYWVDTEFLPKLKVA